ncbi:3-hydroxybutyrate dehydrogenase [Palleronia rufa]|uniref:3-hydroxybutyrate dehydrogenase n=1 Tax=Palleronia rufa TaxID=1530186 RepID=UPI00056CE234|nr:3-hydroxybutyrate dehydrogenase [Palleronia rufa]
MTLEGKTALVTGSTSGIGLEIAGRMAGLGASIVLNGFGDSGQIECERQLLQEEHGIAAMYSPADMSDPDQIAQMVGAALDRFGAIDILVNNAGIQHVEDIETFPPEAWDRIMAINLTAAFHTICHVLPGMREADWGRIVNVASAHSLVASPGKSAYVAAKHGLSGLSKTVALETAEDGITCYCISPGYVRTPLVEKQIPETAKARGMTEDQVTRDVILAAQPTKQFVTAEQVAGAALFLRSPDAAQITGANLSVDGGWTAA